VHSAKIPDQDGLRLLLDFSWLSQNRRMSKYYDKLTATAEAFIYAAMTRLMVRRLARA
jgi:transposase